MIAQAIGLVAEIPASRSESGFVSRGQDQSFQFPERIIMRKVSSVLFAGMVILAVAEAAWANGGQRESLLELYFWDGGWIVWFILGPLSVATVGLAVARVLSIRASVLLPEAEENQLVTMLGAGQDKQALAFLAEKGSFLAEVVSAGLSHVGQGNAAAIRAAEETAEQQTVRLFRKIEMLNVIGNIAPMIGLFGTVYGMILSFQEMAAASLAQRPVEVAAEGIRTALVTTFWGLLVGIPALSVYALFRNKIEALASTGMLKAEQLLERYRLASQGSGPAKGRGQQ